MTFSAPKKWVSISGRIVSGSPETRFWNVAIPGVVQQQGDVVCG